MKQKKYLKTFPYVLLIFGIIFFTIGIIYFVDGIIFKQNAVKVTAEIVDIERYRNTDGKYKHSVFITYEYDGELYEHIPLNEYNNNMYIGKKISILCNSKNPNKIKTNLTLYLLPGILIGIGTVLILISSSLFILSIRKKGQNKKLLTDGRLLHAIVDEINQNTSFSVNGKHPYVIYCSYKDDYKDIIYKFKSQNLWTNPESVFPPGSYIDVYVDEFDYRKYYVKCEEIVSEKVMDFSNL